jgi:hypothetical protein
MGTLLRVLEIIFEVQRKRSNEKITRKKEVFQFTKHGFFSFSFFSLDLLFSKLIPFLFLIHLEIFKVL